jgi:hypothetical protein
MIRQTISKVMARHGKIGRADHVVPVVTDGAANTIVALLWAPRQSLLATSLCTSINHEKLSLYGHSGPRLPLQ